MHPPNAASSFRATHPEQRAEYRAPYKPHEKQVAEDFASGRVPHPQGLVSMKVVQVGSLVVIAVSTCDVYVASVTVVVGDDPKARWYLSRLASRLNLPPALAAELESSARSTVA